MSLVDACLRPGRRRRRFGDQQLRRRTESRARTTTVTLAARAQIGTSGTTIGLQRSSGALELGQSASGRWESVGYALRNLGHASFVERARPKKKVWQHGPPAHDDASHRPWSSVEQADMRVDEAEHWPDEGVGEQIDAGLVDGSDLPVHVGDQLGLVPTPDNETLVSAEEATFVAKLELLARSDLRIDHPHPRRGDGDVIDVAPTPRLVPVVQDDDSRDRLEGLADLLLTWGASHPSLDVLRSSLSLNLRSHRSYETTREWMLSLDPRSPLPIGRDAILLVLAVPLGSPLCLAGDGSAGTSPIELRRRRA